MKDFDKYSFKHRLIGKIYGSSYHLFSEQWQQYKKSFLIRDNLIVLFCNRLNAAYSKVGLESQLNNKRPAAAINTVAGQNTPTSNKKARHGDSLPVASSLFAHEPEILIRVETSSIDTGKYTI